MHVATRARTLQGGVVHNQPYDESLEVSDGEEVPSTNATPRALDQPGIKSIKKCISKLPCVNIVFFSDTGEYGYSNERESETTQRRGYPEEGGVGRHGYPDEGGAGRGGYLEEDSQDDETSESEESEEQEEPPHATLAGYIKIRLYLY